MKNIISILAAALVLALLGEATCNAGVAVAPATKPPVTNPPGALPTVDQVLTKYVQALGGEAAIRKLHSRIILGSLEVPGMNSSASWQLQAKAPNKRVLIMEVQDFGKVIEGFDGKVGWSQNAQTGVALKSGEELARLQRDADFYRDLKFKEFYPQITCAGIEKVGDQEAYVLVAKPTVGRPEKFYFDRKTGLQLRNESAVDAEGGVATMSVSFADYRVVDGVKFPFTVTMDVTMANGAGHKAVLKCREYKHNVALDDAVFSPPKAK